MKVNTINSCNTNFINKKQNINFGRFADNNARNVVKGTLENTTQCCDNYYYGLIDEADYFTAYTDKDGIVKGEFDDEFVKKGILKNSGYYEMLKGKGTMNNLGAGRNSYKIGLLLDDINQILNGLNPFAKIHSTDSDYSYQEEIEAERQARLDNLAK